MARKFHSFYERRIFPLVNDRMAVAPEVAALRAEILGHASGRVVEIGFGTGLNLEHYPADVIDVVALEPNGGMRARALSRIQASRTPAHLIGGEGERLPLPSGSCDSAVSTLTLCSVSDPAQVLRELSRVLRPGGRLIIFEHGLAEDPAIARWQHRLNGLQKIVACGCNLDRPVRDLIQGSGFRFEALRTFYMPHVPRTHAWFTVGVARKSS